MLLVLTVLLKKSVVPTIGLAMSMLQLPKDSHLLQRCLTKVIHPRDGATINVT